MSIQFSHQIKKNNLTCINKKEKIETLECFSSHNMKMQMCGGHKNSCLEYTRTRTYYHRRCKRMMMLFTTNIESLPDEMLLNILLHLPAQVIFQVLRIVCWKWYRIIHTRHFVYEHLKQRLNGSLGLLIQATTTNLSMREQGLMPLTHVSLREQQGRDPTIEISMVSCTAEIHIWASCNGLLLLADDCRVFHHEFEGVGYYIENPTTKQRLFLPKFICPTLKSYTSSGLAYVASSKEYKVVVTYGKLGKEECCILTVGVDSSWRHINTQHLSISARIVLCCSPVTTEGFLHWYRDSIVVTLNAETETLTEFHAPQIHEKNFKFYHSTGTSYLCFAVSVSELSWEAWEMKPETGEWTKLPNIDLEAQKHVLTENGCSSTLHLEPIGWLKYKEVMLFNTKPYVSKHYFAYDARIQKIYWFELDFPMYNSLAHVNSLVCLDG